MRTIVFLIKKFKKPIFTHLLGRVHHAGVVPVLERRAEGGRDDGEHQPSVEALKHGTAKRFIVSGLLYVRRRPAGREFARPREAREMVAHLAYCFQIFTGGGSSANYFDGEKNAKKMRPYAQEVIQYYAVETTNGMHRLFCHATPLFAVTSGYYYYITTGAGQEDRDVTILG